MNEQPTKQPVVGLSDAIERAATALEYRIHLTETEGIPEAEARRNGGVAAVLREGLTNDKAALAVLRAAAADSAKAPLADRSAFDSSDWLDFLGRLENEFARREDFWRNIPSDPHQIASAVMVAMAESKTVLRTVIEEVVARKSNERAQRPAQTKL